MKMIAGNKGEWSELYVLLYLLSHGRLDAADENLNVLNNVFFPILKIIREEKNEHIEYVIPKKTSDVFDYDKELEEDSTESNSYVEIFVNDDCVGRINQQVLSEETKRLYDAIVNSNTSSFTVNETVAFMDYLHCKTLKASSREKADISMWLHDINTGYESICGFSIKSDLGNPPTLLNASEATNFIYTVSGLSQNDIEIINSIEGNRKIIDRLAAIYEKGSKIEFYGMRNVTFQNNLLMIDSLMKDILAHILLYSYKNGVTNCSEVISAIEDENPLQYPRSGIYSYKFKKFLCAIALGMMPSKEWSGYDEANGGYIIVKKAGDVVAYHIYNRNKFEDYLLANTKFERASTSRHKYASIYENNNSVYINLNLQIRFI